MVCLLILEVLEFGVSGRIFMVINIEPVRISGIVTCLLHCHFAVATLCLL